MSEHSRSASRARSSSSGDLDTRSRRSRSHSRSGTSDHPPPPLRREPGPPPVSYVLRIRTQSRSRGGRSSHDNAHFDREEIYEEPQIGRTSNIRPRPRSTSLSQYEPFTPISPETPLGPSTSYRSIPPAHAENPELSYPYVCTVCPSRFLAEGDLKNHYKTTHVCCVICLESPRAQKKRTHAKQDVFTKRVGISDIYWSSRNALSSHYNIHIPQSFCKHYKPNSVIYCRKHFPRNNERQKHESECTGTSEQPALSEEEKNYSLAISEALRESLQSKSNKIYPTPEELAAFHRLVLFMKIDDVPHKIVDFNDPDHKHVINRIPEHILREKPGSCEISVPGSFKRLCDEDIKLDRQLANHPKDVVERAFKRYFEHPHVSKNTRQSGPSSQLHPTQTLNSPLKSLPNEGYSYNAQPTPQALPARPNEFIDRRRGQQTLAIPQNYGSSTGSYVGSGTGSSNISRITPSTVYSDQPEVKYINPNLLHLPRGSQYCVDAVYNNGIDEASVLPPHAPVAPQPVLRRKKQSLHGGGGSMYGGGGSMYGGGGSSKSRHSHESMDLDEY